MVVTRKGLLIVAPVEKYSDEQLLKKKIRFARGPFAFDKSNLEGTIQPHDDALVVMARISGFAMKRVMIDQGSGADVMYLTCLRDLGLVGRTSQSTIHLWLGLMARW